MRDQLLEGIDAMRDTGRILGGVASIEAPSGDVVTVAALTADEVGGPAEVALTDEARDLVAALPFPEIDVLVIEEGGKDISGTTLDPNVTGRFWVDGLADLPAPKVAMIVLLGLTPVTAGNVTGIGFVDFVPAALADADRLGGDVRQLVHGRRVGRAAGPDADGAARRGVVHPGRPADVRQAVRRAEEGRAHPLDAAPDALLGQRRPARRPALRACTHRAGS